jgi:hypothetical protein
MLLCWFQREDKATPWKTGIREGVYSGFESRTPRHSTCVLSTWLEP